MKNITLICALLLSLPLLANGKDDLIHPSDNSAACALLSLNLPETERLTIAQTPENSPENLTTLFEHIQNNRTDKAIELIHQGIVPLDVPNQQGNLPIHEACLRGNMRLFHVLLNKNPGQKSIKSSYPLGGTPLGFTPLHFAAGGGHIPIMQSLLDLGVQLDEKLKHGRTAFHIACAGGQIPVAQWLLTQKPAMLDEKTNHGTTGLHIAVGFKKKPMVEFLMTRMSLPEIAKNEALWNSIGELLRDEPAQNITGEKRSASQNNGPASKK